MNKSMQLFAITAVLIVFGLYLLLPKQITALAADEPEDVKAQTLLSPAVPASRGIQGSPGSINTNASELSDLNDAVNRYIQSLANDKAFEDWEHAGWKSYPLGPGMHGWVVILTKEAQDIGYLITHATPDGQFRLSEYGTGSNPLFSLSTLYQTLIRQALISSSIHADELADKLNLEKSRLYFNALHAVWRLEIKHQIYFFDAKTGEQLPLTDDLLPSLDNHLPVSEKYLPNDQVQHSLQLPVFDPYERLNWIQHPPLKLDSFDTYKETLSAPGHVTYVAEPFNGRITKPLAVTGYHEWQQSEPYILLEEEGNRYIPFSISAQLGNFYK